MEFRVSAAQIPVTRDIAANVAAIGRAIEFARAERADVLLTPEGSVSGYTHEFDRCAVASAINDLTVQARAARLALALGTCFTESDGRCYDQVRFYDAAGAFLGFHSKTLTCGTLVDPPRGEIEHYAVAPLRTFELKGVRVGALVCNDLWANPSCTPMPDPHLTQQLARLGARVIFHGVNGDRGPGEESNLFRMYHESNLRARALAGKLWIVTVDNCHPVELPCSSPGGVIDPAGQWALKAPIQGEHFFAHTIELRSERLND